MKFQDRRIKSVKILTAKFLQTFTWFLQNTQCKMGLGTGLLQENTQQESVFLPRPVPPKQPLPGWEGRESNW